VTAERPPGTKIRERENAVALLAEHVDTEAPDHGRGYFISQLSQSVAMQTCAAVSRTLPWQTRL
jgi:hypothetical protein